MPSKNLPTRVAACAALAAAFLTASMVCAQGPSAPAAVVAPAPPLHRCHPRLPPSYVVNLDDAGGHRRRSTRSGRTWTRRSSRSRPCRVPGQMENGVRHSAACRRKRLRRSVVADHRTPRPAGRTARRWQGVLHVVPREPHHSGRDRRLSTRRAPRRSSPWRVDDYAEVWVNGQMPSPRRLPQPRDDPGLQHAESRGARGRRQGGRQVPRSRFSASTGRFPVAPLNTVWFREAKIEFYRYGPLRSERFRLGFGTAGI